MSKKSVRDVRQSPRTVPQQPLPVDALKISINERNPQVVSVKHPQVCVQRMPLAMYPVSREHQQRHREQKPKHDPRELRPPASSVPTILCTMHEQKLTLSW